MNNKIALALLISTPLLLVGCKTLDQVNRDLAKLNSALETPRTPAPPPIVMATPLDEKQATKTQLVIPKDEKIKAAVDGALPNIKKILAVHSCIQDYYGMRALNQYALPGLDMGLLRDYSYWGHVTDLNPPILQMRYHDKNKCVGVRSIEKFFMPALNALEFSIIYFAEDSGETIKYKAIMKKADDGNWLLGAGIVPDKY